VKWMTTERLEAIGAAARRTARAVGRGKHVARL
jgi:hypothetical protein